MRRYLDRVGGGWLATLGVGVALASCTPTPTEIATEGSSSQESGGDTNVGTTALPTATDSTLGATGDAGDDATTSSADGGTDGTDGSSSGGSSSDTGATVSCTPVLAELVVAVSSGDNGDEWVKLHNPCDDSIDLSGYSLGWGGHDYTTGSFDLTGSLRPGACIVVGGPNSNSNNGGPDYGITYNFAPDLQNGGGGTADGVALFDVPSAMVIATEPPVDVVIYGNANDSGLLDTQGNVPDPYINAPPNNHSLRRTALDVSWEIADSPTPNDCPTLR